MKRLTILLAICLSTSLTGATLPKAREVLPFVGLVSYYQFHYELGGRPTQSSCAEAALAFVNHSTNPFRGRIRLDCLFLGGGSGTLCPDVKLIRPLTWGQTNDVAFGRYVIECGETITMEGFES